MDIQLRPQYLFAIFVVILPIYFYAQITHMDTYCGIITFACQTGIDLMISVLALQLSASVNMPVDKKRLFRLISISFIFAALADSTYNIFYNALGLPILSTLACSIFEAPFLAFLLTQLIFWSELFSQSNNTHFKNKKILYVPFLLSTTFIMLIFIFFIHWKIEFSSISGIYQLCDTIIESVCFALISFCLCTAKNKNILYIASGFLTVIASDYLIKVGVIENSIYPNSIFELAWIMGLISIYHGIFKISKTNFTEDIWCYPINSIQSQFAIWNFIACTIILIFTTLSLNLGAYLSHNQIELGVLPTIFIIFSSISIFASTLFSRKLFSPLKDIEGTIKNFIHTDKKILSSAEKNDYGILEYIELKKFLNTSLNTLAEKMKAEKALFNLAAQVAHDIHSPLAVIEMIRKSALENHSPAQANIQAQAIQNIRDITHNLLNKYRAPTLELATASAVPLATMIHETFTQKKQEWSGNPCNLVYDTRPDPNIMVKSVNNNSLKCILSNLLNNAYEALCDIRKISLAFQANDIQFHIKITDTGKGIESDKIDAVLSGLSLKHEGNGLGLSRAKQYMENIGGNLFLSSKIGLGTTITLVFPTEQENNTVYI